MSENPQPTIEALQDEVIIMQRKVIAQLERKIELQESVVCGDRLDLSLIRRHLTPSSN